VGKIYGGRWEIIGVLGEGGQSNVFEARDKSAPDSRTVALKRVKNPNRHARFRTEVEAIKQLNHPNIIKLIDHSALDNTSDAPDRQYLVMPVARRVIYRSASAASRAISTAP
jgi:serine/threonine protein kinase